MTRKPPVAQEPQPPAQPARSGFRFHPLTWAGLALVVLFLVLCGFDNTAIRWWLMLPLAGAGSAILLRQVRHAVGLERKVCLWGFWILLGLLVLRDLRMSQKLADLYDKMQEVSRNVNDAYRSFETFMNGKPR